jgi:hypothetical protein
MRVLTRGDFDGLACVVLLDQVFEVIDILFTHPKDVQDNKVAVGKNDIVVNLPYIKGCALWFDHHISEETKLPEIGNFNGKFAIAPSAAQVIYEYYKSPKFARFEELLDAANKLDSAALPLDEVANPHDWILVGMTIDPRSGAGKDYRDYFLKVRKYAEEMSLEALLQQPEVKKRCQRVLEEQEANIKLLQKHSRLENNVIVTDLRGVKEVPAGNRFLIYTLYLDANVELRIFPGILGNTIVAVGDNIFNRTNKVNLGKLMAKYGGGGHKGAATCQIADEDADFKIAEIIRVLKEQ